MPVIYDDYTFDTEEHSELRQLIEEYNHIFNGDFYDDIMGAWRLEKPASAIEIMPPEDVQLQQFPDEETAPAGTREEIGYFLYEIQRWFHYQFDDYNLFISRFKDLPGVLAGESSSAIHGILYGYPTKDVAQHLIESKSSSRAFKSEAKWEP